VTIEKIKQAIEKARKGITQYLEIMELFPRTDVSVDKGFQRKFNRFYRIRQKPAVWYKEYYSYMEIQKNQLPDFSATLRHLHSVLNRYEPSFSSKLVATIDSNLPIWDSIVLNNMNIKPPLYTSRTKIDEAERIYKQIQEWHETNMKSDKGQLILQTFRELVPEHNKISDLKKIDFVLWQSRAEQAAAPNRRETTPASRSVRRWASLERPGRKSKMTKMDMIWIAVASMLHPETSASKTVTRGQIEAHVTKLFAETITPVMIERHLVSFEDRQADKTDPRRGGSRNRYLFRTVDGNLPSRDGRFRIYKQADSKHDGWEKTGPTHPDPAAVAAEYRSLIDWYRRQYVGSAKQ
jgi:hypothetical protein